ncbi:hypothetical protein IMZ08_17330 [Bacillus luteolus]|uniref:DUF4878 domain-containing protein n=1 Tax=Litchfieldia luteola TaxID=682179 RepID=A0ABR9QMS3_9BACI|nr:hypothetical protein [Cytobacillus luteolus]MBE4909799.1 hypothetical protein [Cytobacillus luteolus]MBP1942657.1 hypothetical protein [Cytobacillus luteolus]
MTKKILWGFGAILVIGLLVVGYLWKESAEDITATEQLERYYEVYNNKDFEAFYDMLSEKEQEELEANNKRQDILKGFEKAWRVIEVIKIEEQDGGTKNGTIVAATVSHPPHGSEPKITFIETFKLIKVTDEWKFDDYISKEIVD